MHFSPVSPLKQTDHSESEQTQMNIRGNEAKSTQNLPTCQLPEGERE